MVTETIFALIYQHPCRSVLDQDAATGELLLAAPVCSPLCCNANMQLSEENTSLKTALDSCYNPRTILLVG